MMSGYQGEVPIEEHGNGGGKQVREGEHFKHAKSQGLIMSWDWLKVVRYGWSREWGRGGSKRNL